MPALRLDLGAAKEPLGLVRGLQWIFSIFAFATCGRYSGSVSFGVSCSGGPNVTVTAAFGYPFRLNRATFAPPLKDLCNGTWAADVHLVGDFAAAAQFFVAVAAAAFVYAAAALAVYLGCLGLYRAGAARLPMADFVATVVFSFLWLVSTSAWAKALTDVKVSVAAPLPGCRPPTTCSAAAVSPAGSLNVSVIFGFLNLLLWAAGSWFVYKETDLHRPPPPPPAAAPGAL
ncbi:synaptophysin-like protein 1 [Rhea pennata]|uniref:synaptophysin-like protein 1 n=1 Tax=Rhea pennata TaxID=8795 RepID=UPI002E264B2B